MVQVQQSVQCTAGAVLVTRPALGTVIPVPSCLRLRLRLRLHLAVHSPQGREPGTLERMCVRAWAE